MKPMLKITLSLAVICAIAAAGLAAVNQMTKKAIAINNQKEVQESLSFLFPQSERFDPVSFTNPSPESSQKGKDFNILELYQAIQEDSGIGYVFKVETKGYGGEILLLIAISTQDQNMEGIKILEHQETPGLGSEITSSHFQDQFKGKSLSDPYEINQDIQALSGATISSKAIIRACRGVIAYLEKETNR